MKCLVFPHYYKQIPVTSKTTYYEDGKMKENEMYYIIVCTKCGDIIWEQTPSARAGRV